MRELSVLIIQRVLPDYRIPFFKALYRELKSKGINLTLIYGQEKPGTYPKTQAINESWSKAISNKYFDIYGLELVWQPCVKDALKSDIVIVEQSNRLIINFLLITRLVTPRIKLAYWGHGKNYQAKNRRKISEAIKKLLIGNVDWWFAYTDSTKRLLRLSNYDVRKITVVQNSIDTNEIIESKESITKYDLGWIRKQLNINSDYVAIYCGSIYKEKKIEFLIQTCELVRKSLVDFHLVVVGDGPDVNIVKDKAEKTNWLHYVGNKYRKEKVLYFLSSKILLMPGAVGLVAIDSFALQIPIITCREQSHGPEIEYIINYENGLIANNDIEEYAETVITYFESKKLQDKLREGCKKSAEKYTLEKMVKNFAAGIESCQRQNY